MFSRAICDFMLAGSMRIVKFNAHSWQGLTAKVRPKVETPRS
jgi:hypothetical protein